MTAPHRTAAGLGFWLNLPDGWIPIEATGERIPDQIERLVQTALERNPLAAAHRGKVERQIASALRAARTRELVFGAVLATFTPDGLPIAASLAATKHPVPSGADADAILADLASGGAKTNSLVDTPFAGTVVRSAFVDRVPVDDARPGEPATADVAVFQYFLLTPDGRQVVIITGATPTVPMTEVFGTLFDAVVSTFQFVDEPVRDDARSGACRPAEEGEPKHGRIRMGLVEGASAGDDLAADRHPAPLSRVPHRDRRRPYTNAEQAQEG